MNNITKKEITEILKPYNEDIKRHMGALKEDFHEWLNLKLGEGVTRG